jgi:capsular polysaccharide biosynthesis protein
VLNPEQAARLRKLIDEKTDVSAFEGFRIDCRDIDIRATPSGAETIMQESGGTGRMYTPEQIFGTPHDETCLNGVGNHIVHTPVKILYQYRNATIAGNTAVFGDFGIAAPTPVVPGPAFETLQSSTQPNFSGFVLHHDQAANHATVHFVAAEKKIGIRGTAVFFHNPEPGNYGSFLFRVLPQMLFVAEQKDQHFDFYITPGRPAWFMEAVRLAGLPELPVFDVNEVVGETFESVLMCNEFDNEGWFDAKTLARLHALRDRVLRAEHAAAAATAERLYVSRQLAGGHHPNYRRLINEDEVAQLAQANGFRIIYPETLSFSKQISAFAAAKAIIGPSGSGMLNAIFAPAETRVLDIESFHFTVRQHAKIYSSTFKTYAFAFGDIPTVSGSPAFSNWRIDLPSLAGGIEWIAAK